MSIPPPPGGPPPPPPPPGPPGIPNLPPPPPPPGPGSGGSPSGPIGASEGLSWGWKKFTANAGNWIILMLIPFVVLIAVSIVRAATTPSGFGGLLLSGLIFGFLSFAIGQIATYGLFRMAVGTANGESPTIGQAFNLDLMGPYVVAALLEGVIVGIGTLLCFLPGIVAAVALVFTPFYVLDQKMAPVEAMKASVNLVKNNLGALIGPLLLALVAYVAGVIACGIGLLVSGPVALLSVVYVYKRINGQPVAA